MLKPILMATFVTILGACAAAGQPPAAGSKAPGFSLRDQNGDWHNLEDYRGRWLAVYFYPRDDTPGCTTEACSFRDNIFAFEAIGAHVVGISVDDVRSHRAFADRYSLPFTLLADTGGEVSRAYGVLRDFKLVQAASRQSFIIGPDGTVRKHYGKVDPATHTLEVLGDLRSMMAADQGR